MPHKSGVQFNEERRIRARMAKCERRIAAGYKPDPNSLSESEEARLERLTGILVLLTTKEVDGGPALA